MSGPTAFAMTDEGLQSSTSMLQGIEDLIQAAGPAFGPILFVVTYTASAVVLIPASLLTVAAGYLFGPVEGTILVSVASTLGATASFLVGRYIARPAVTRAVRKVPENGQKFDAIDAAITKDGVKIVVLLRLSPIVPYTLLNYALSITSIPLPQYVLASWAGMLPGTVAYVALGGVGKAASGSGYSIQQIVLYSIGVAATLGASVLLSRAAKRALDEEIQTQSPPVEGDDGGLGRTLYPYGMVPMRQGVAIEEILNRLKGPPVDVRPMEGDSSAFVKPKTVRYTLDGKQRRWDMVFSHDSVAILLYHTQLQAFLLVRQFRPPVYANILRDCEHDKSSSAPSLESAFVFELCAGLVDKPGLSLSEIASEEVMEETGYSVPATELRQVTSFLTSVGLSGSRQTIFAANIDEECLCSAAAAGGGGLASHGEAIDVVALPVSSVNDFLVDETVPKSAGLMFSLLWGKGRVVANGGRGLF